MLSIALNHNRQAYVSSIISFRVQKGIKSPIAIACLIPLLHVSSTSILILRTYRPGHIVDFSLSLDFRSANNLFQLLWMGNALQAQDLKVVMCLIANLLYPFPNCEKPVAEASFSVHACPAVSCHVLWSVDLQLEFMDVHFPLLRQPEEKQQIQIYRY